MEDYLVHHGILGQKWGIRRYQNKDGTLTPLGKKKAEKLEAKYAKITGKKIDKAENTNQNNTRPKYIDKNVRDMSDEEVESARKRYQNEKLILENRKAIAEMQRKPDSVFKKALKGFANDVLAPVGKNLSKTFLEKLGNKAIGSIFGEQAKEAKEAVDDAVKSAKKKQKKEKKAAEQAQKVKDIFTNKKYENDPQYETVAQLMSSPVYLLPEAKKQ